MSKTSTVLPQRCAQRSAYGFQATTSTFVAMLVLFAAAAAAAEPTAPRIGVLVPEMGRSQAQAIKGLRDEFKQRRYQEGKNIFLEVRNASGDRGRLPAAAVELAQSKSDVIVTTGTRATQAAKASAQGTAIVFIHPADPVSLGLVKSLERPEIGITGVAGFALQATGKRLQILRQLVPDLVRIHVFYDANTKYSRDNIQLTKAAAAKLNVTVVEYGVKSADELRASAVRVQNHKGDAIFYFADDLIDSEAQWLLDYARQNKLPTMFDGESWAIKGAMAAYGPSFYTMGRQAAGLAELIVKGRRAEPLPVAAADKFDLILNYRTASFIGVRFADPMLKSATRVIR